jgi:hypothetical protein
LIVKTTVKRRSINSLRYAHTERTRDFMQRIKSITIALPFAVLLFSAAIPGKPASSTGEINTDRPAPNGATLYGFANITDSTAYPKGLVQQTCNDYARSIASDSGRKASPPTQEEARQLSKAVTDELAKRLSKKMPVTIAKPEDMPSEGSLVITGCFLSADRGNAAARLVGFGLGASHLSSHVRIAYMDGATPKTIDEFDTSVKGSNKLPPAGPVGLGINAVRETQATMQADARRLADNILKRWQADQQRRQTNQAKR